MALNASDVEVELREVLLREKPVEMLEASPKGTVPVLVFEDGEVLEESLDIINWSLSKSDRSLWCDYENSELDRMEVLIQECDGPFKSALDRYKYPNRYADVDREVERGKGASFIRQLNELLEGTSYLFGDRFSKADGAILPFVRQFAHVDRDWFWAEDWPNVIRWLEDFLQSEQFQYIMTKFAQWQSGTEGQQFGGKAKG